MLESNDYDFIVHTKVSRANNGLVVKEDFRIESSPSHLVKLIKKSDVQIDYAEYLNDDAHLDVQVVVNDAMDDDEIMSLFHKVNEFHTETKTCDVGIIISCNNLDDKNQFINELRDNNFIVNSLELEE